QQTSDGGFIITGCTSSYGAGDMDVWLIKTDEYGNEEWNQTFGGIDSDQAYTVKQTTDGGFIVAGYTDSFGEGYHNCWIIKTDEEGNEEWNRTFGNYDSRCNYVQQTIDGGYILAGATWLFEANNYFDVWLIKTDKNGDEEWSQIYGGAYWDEACSAQQTSDGGFIMGGYTWSYGCSGDFWLIKTDGEGNIEWNQTYGGGNIDICSSVSQTNDDGYILTGYTYSYGAGDMDFWLIKTDESGNEVWNRTFGGSSEDWAHSVQQTIDGGYIIVGETTSFGEGNLWIIKTDEQGNEIWNKTYGDDNGEIGNSIEQTTDGGYIIAGVKRYIDTGWSDVLLIRVGSDNAISEENVTSIESHLSNYPNPFNNSTEIKFSLQKTGFVIIDVYNIKGQKIKTLIREHYQKGNHQVFWNGDDETGKKVISGIYFYKLNVNGKNEVVKKCLLLK
ncbi:MAG: T9SS type A sorting domain-containing protein, partial [Candidatus Cloacimonetes bacterium]|nr:T9SS type A sorting domain-containing protein [Candidatus Cloacimonadota bacterium]